MGDVLNGVVGGIRAKRGLAISAASGAASLAGAVLTAISIGIPGTPRWFAGVLAGITILAFVPVFLAMCLRPKAVEGKRRLSDNEADEMVVLAVKARTVPTCVHLPVHHASGTAIMAFGVKSCYSSVGRLFNLLDTIIGELRKEHRFTTQAVTTHLQEVAKLRHCISGMVSSLDARQCLDLPDLHQAKEILWLAQQRVRIAQKGLVLLLRRTPQGALWDREHPQYKTEIEKSLKSTIPDSLEGLKHGKTSFTQAGKNLAAFVEVLETDWHADVQQVWRDDKCRPD